jgi:hypothetical protein
LAQQQQQRGEEWATQNVLMEGGLYLDRDTIFQAEQMPGSARALLNFEASLDGGYARILGYTKFDAAQLPNGAVQVFGTIANFIDSTVIAMQSGITYQGSGSGWTKISGADTHAGMGKVNWTFYSWATNRFAWCDGDPAAHPVRIETGGVYTVLTNAPVGQKYIQEFSGYLFMTAGDGTLTFSAPQNDNDYNAGDGAGTINVGFPIVGLGVWRGALYILGQNKISQLTGTSAADWTVTPLTDDVGMVAPYTLQEVNGDLIFLSQDGIRTISGTARIFDRELGVISRPINTGLIPMGASNWTSLPIRDKSQYRIFQGTSSTDPTTAAGVIGTLKLQTNGSTAWEWTETAGILVACASSGLINNVETVVFGNWDGYVYKMESGEDFSGTAIQALYRTPYLIFNDANIRKIMRKIMVNTKASGATTINLGLVFDTASAQAMSPPNTVITLSGGGGAWDEGLLWDDGVHVWDIFSDARIVANLSGSGFNCSLSFTSNGGSHYSITGYSLQYSIGARR